MLILGHVRLPYCGLKRIRTENGSGALSGKMLLVRIIENNKIDAYFRSG